MKTIYTDGDLLNEMTRELDFESIVYGARGQYGIGAQYDKFADYKMSLNIFYFLLVKTSIFFFLKDIYNKANAIKLMRKAIPTAFANGIEGFGVNPIVLTIKK